METTVTGVFAGAADAQRARDALAAAGVAAPAIEVITADTENRHSLIGAETSDVARGALLGAAVGGIGMGIGGIAMAVKPLELFSLHPAVAALLFGGLGAAAGFVIGLLVGSATGHQVQEEYEHVLERGGVLLAVNTERANAQRAHDLLASCGATMLSTSVHRRHRAPVQRSA